MEGINPTLSLLLALRFGLECGQPVRQSCLQFCDQNKDGLGLLVKQWVLRREMGTDPIALLHPKQSVQLQSLLRVMDRGLCGESIHVTLTALEGDIREAAQEDLEQFLAQLPFKMLIPLLLLQFPAFMLILLGPMLQDLLRSL